MSDTPALILRPVDKILEGLRDVIAGNYEVRATSFVPTNAVSNIAPKGWVWRCGACGKTTRDSYGEEGGWDESCMLNAYLAKALT